MEVQYSRAMRLCHISGLCWCLVFFSRSIGGDKMLESVTTLPSEFMFINKSFFCSDPIIFLLDGKIGQWWIVKSAVGVFHCIHWLRMVINKLIYVPFFLRYLEEVQPIFKGFLWRQASKTEWLQHGCSWSQGFVCAFCFSLRLSKSCPFSDHISLYLHHYSETLQQAKDLIKAMKENKVKLFTLIRRLNPQFVFLAVYSYHGHLLLRT